MLTSSSFDIVNLLKFDLRTYKRWRGCIYTPLRQIQPLPAESAKLVLTGRAGRRDRTRRSSVTVEKRKSALSDRTRRSEMTGRAGQG
jgi:hypothetical protein